MIIAKYVLRTPIYFNIRKSGNMVTCAGIIMELSSTLNNLSFPLNRYFAKAYPAIELKNSDISVTIVDKNKLLIKFTAPFSLENKLVYCSIVNSSGQNRGGNTLACPSAINEAETIQMNGVNVNKAPRTRIRYKTSFLNSFIHF
jgi:hypothetical protein